MTDERTPLAVAQKLAATAPPGVKGDVFDLDAAAAKSARSLEPRFPTNLTDLAAMAARADAEYRGALIGAVSTLETLEKVRQAVKNRESTGWIETKEVDGKAVPLFDGKNEQTRDAQFLQWSLGDSLLKDLRIDLTNVLRDHRLAEAKVNAALETCKTVRALLYGLAPDRGQG